MTKIKTWYKKGILSDEKRKIYGPIRGGALNSLEINGVAAGKSYAFTLAEVLIALAIIGVVAAMTIPTFMANTAGAQFRTGFKKGITVLTHIRICMVTPHHYFTCFKIT